MAKVKPQSIDRKKISWLLEQPIDVKLEMLSYHMEIIRLLINEILEDEVFQLAGERYSRSKPHEGRYSRWGFNPGSVEVGGEKLRISIPRVFDTESDSHISLKTYEQLKTLNAMNEQLMKRVLFGVSTADYASVIGQLLDSFGLSRSSVSKRFVETSEEQLTAFMERNLSDYDFIALFLDGKYLAKEQIIIALGVTIEGDKIPIGFIQTHSENAKSITELLSSLIERGFHYQQGILCICDGSKGIRKAVKDAFGKYALIQRCQWHKRENVLSYLNATHQEIYRDKLKSAYRIDRYEDAKKSLLEIKNELSKINISAANSLAEGLEETLTLHRLNIHHLFAKSFATTNCIESVNAHLKKYIGRVKYWKNSSQRHRWMACGLIEIEQRMRKVDNYQKLHLMREAVKKELKIDSTKPMEAA